MPNEKLDTTNKLIKPDDISTSDDAIIRQLSDNLQNITTDDVNSMCDEIDAVKKKEKIEKLRGNTGAILTDLRENHVKKENAEMMGHKGKKIYVDIPAIGNFKGFKFECFVSDDNLSRLNLDDEPKLQEKSYSMENVAKLLQAMNKYMIELQGKHDGNNMDYENELKNWKYCRKYAGEFFKYITGLNSFYWLNDKNITGGKSSYAIWLCHDKGCYFYRGNNDYYSANLLLKLSD